MKLRVRENKMAVVFKARNHHAHSDPRVRGKGARSSPGWTKAALRSCALRMTRAREAGRGAPTFGRSGATKSQQTSPSSRQEKRRHPTHPAKEKNFLPNRKPEESSGYAQLHTGCGARAGQPRAARDFRTLWHSNPGRPQTPALPLTVVLLLRPGAGLETVPGASASGNASGPRAGVEEPETAARGRNAAARQQPSHGVKAQRGPDTRDSRLRGKKTLQRRALFLRSVVALKRAFWV